MKTKDIKYKEIQENYRETEEEEKRIIFRSFLSRFREYFFFVLAVEELNYCLFGTGSIISVFHQ